MIYYFRAMKITIILTILLSITVLFAQQTRSDDYNRLLLAQSFEQQGDYEKAQKIYEELYQKEPTNINYFNSLNRVYTLQKNFAASISLLENRLNDYPNDINLIGQLGSTYYMSGNYDKAYQIWEEPLKKPEASQVTFRVIANFAIERRAFDKAIEILEKGKPTTKDPFIFSMDLANLYSLTMRYEKAAEEYSSILETSPTQLAVVQSRILSYINKPGALEKTIKVVENKRKSDNLSILFLLARLYTEQKDFQKAFGIYSELDNKQQSQGAELYNYAEFIFREGEFEIASSVYNTIIERYPDSKIVSSAKLGYAKSQEAILKMKFLSSSEDWKTFSLPPRLDSKTVEPAVKAFEEITKIYAHSEVAVESYLRMAQIRFRLQNDPASAKDLLAIIIRNYPMSRLSIEAYLDMAEIKLIEGNIEESERFYEEALNLRSASAEKKNEAHFHLAKIKSYKGNFEQARIHLSEILKNLKDNLANDALEISIILNTAKNDSSNLLLFSEAELLAERMLFDKAKEKYDLIAQDQKAFIFHSIVKLRSAQMDIALRNYASAVESLIIISEEKEKNIYADKVLYLLGNIYEFVLNETPKAIESYERLLLEYAGSIYIDKARERILFLRSKTS
jgi:tetratricopeptide (TPR) repeat protein